jgi:hypothetical protein
MHSPSSSSRRTVSASVSTTHDQDLTAQQDALATLGVSAERTYVDHGLTGTNRERPGLREALAACRGGDTLVVTKLDRCPLCLKATAMVLDLHPIGSSRAPSLCLCTGRNASGQVALP